MADSYRSQRVINIKTTRYKTFNVIICAADFGRILDLVGSEYDFFRSQITGFYAISNGLVDCRDKFRGIVIFGVNNTSP